MYDILLWSHIEKLCDYIQVSGLQTVHSFTWNGALQSKNQNIRYLKTTSQFTAFELSECYVIISDLTILLVLTTIGDKPQKSDFIHQIVSHVKCGLGMRLVRKSHSFSHCLSSKHVTCFLNRNMYNRCFYYESGGIMSHLHIK